MRLKKLEIQGFKSFADKTQIAFEQGVTGIVGPNGCGKSNISDAVRWVLGEQSAKTLRGAKMEDVIFGGTEKRRRLSCCEVTLSIENEDGALPLSFGEVAVARRAYRDGNTEYSINGAPCRLRDVIDLFRDTGIGKEGYSLIGQGRIDEILAAKSEDRRQIFEEAAGIVKYKARRNDALRRMENTSLNLARVEDILAELESRVEPLKAQSEAAREYLQLRDELKTLELNLFLLRTDRYNVRIKELQETIEHLAEDIAAAETRQSELTQGRDGQQETLTGLEAQAAQAREAVQALIREVEAQEGDVKVLGERIAAGERDRARAKSDLESARSGGGGVDAQLSALTERIAQSREALEATQARLTADEAALSEKEAALEVAEADSERAKAQVIDAMNRMSDVKSERARLTAMGEALSARVASLAGDETRDSDQSQALEAQVRACEETLAAERAEKEKLDKLAEDAANRVRTLGEEGEILRERTAKLLSERQETSSRLRVLEEMQRDYEGYQFSVKNVLLQARRTPDAGVRGVVADLLRVPERIERAIDMALSGALQHIVVDREEDAKRMIEFLRKNRMGRATFLPLSAVRGRTLDASERRLLSMPGCLGVASELVDFDPVYKGVVENLLGRTVVAENLDSGIAILRSGRHAFRRVTLEGDVMNPGGAMSGGSVHSQMTSLLSRSRELTAHREKLAAIENELKAAQAREKALEGDRAGLKRERAELFESVHQQEIACAREEAHLAAAREEFSAHRARAERVGEARAQLSEQLQSVRAQLEALSGREAGEDGLREAKNDEILRLQAVITALRSDVAALQKTVSDARVECASAQRDARAMEADQARLSRQKGDLGRMSQESESALYKAVEALTADRALLTEKETALAAEKAALNAARTVFSALDEKRVAAQARIREAAEALDALRGELDALVDKHHRGEVQLARMESELTQLTDRIWEDYELSYEGATAFRAAEFKTGESEKRVAQIKARIKEMGSVNVAAVDEYRQTAKRVEELGAQRDDLVKAGLDLQAIVEELEKKMEAQFKREFAKLNVNFQETFVKLFGGGQAELRLADPSCALTCGVDIVAQPPGKKLQMLSLLSGGERALTAIAILFAMLKLKPTPFCFLDEIEAALDDANIDNFAAYLKEYSHKTQFVVVTHRKGTMECCDALYGVAMEEKGVSKLVSVKLNG